MGYNKKKISVIIPMYNVAPYMGKCITSLENQDISMDQVEIICINDGSPDNCVEIVKNLKKHFSNIILIEQENQGVSVARNRGIDEAVGEYILFIDPDDYIDPCSFSRVLNYADEMQADVTFLGYTFLSETGLIQKSILFRELQGKVCIGTEAYFLARGDGKTDPDRMVAVLFKRDFFSDHNLRYLPDVPYLEDGEFIARILCLAERCAFESNSFYQRTTRQGSATNSNLFHSDKATIGFLKAANNLKRFQQEKELNQTQKIFLNQPVAKFVLLAINSAFRKRSFKKIRDTIKSLRNKGLKKINLAGCKNEYRLYGSVYNISPGLAVIIMAIIPRMNRGYLSGLLRRYFN